MTTALIAYYSVGAVATVFAAVLACAFAVRRGWSLSTRALLVAISVVPVFLLTAQLLKFASLHLYADFSHWLQLFRSIAATGIPYVANQAYAVPGTGNYFSAHFVPLVYLLAVPFRGLPYPQTLLVLNVAIMCSAAIPLYRIARRHTNDRRFALLAAALLLWYPTFQYLTLYEFEVLRFSIPALLWMIDVWDQQRLRWYYAFAILAILVREEVGLTVGMFGVYLALVERRRLHGIATALLGFGAFVGITQAVMPFFAPSDAAFAHVAAGAFGVPGDTPIEVIGNLLRNPIVALTAIVHPVKLANLAMLFLPLLGIPLLAPSALIPALPTFAIGLLSYSTIHSSFFLYYVSPAIPFLFLACIRAWPRVVGWLNVRDLCKSPDARLGDAVRLHCALRPLVRSFRYHSGLRRAVRSDCVADPSQATFAEVPARVRTDARNAAMIGIVVATLTAGVFFGPTPFALQFWSERFRPAPFRTLSFHHSTYRVTDHHRVAAEAIAAIPDHAIVATQQFLLPRLARGQSGMALPQIVSADGSTRATHLLYDTTNNGLRSQSPAYVTVEEFAAVRGSDVWTLVRTQDGYELYERR